MYACICARVRECEVRSAIAGGATDEDTVSEVTGAGTGCGSCVDRICGLLREIAPSAALRDLRVAS